MSLSLCSDQHRRCALTNVNVVDDNGTADTGDDVTIGTIASLAVGVTDTSLTHTFTVNKDTTNIATATGTTRLVAPSRIR